MNITIKDMLDSGVHYGHLSSRWHPKMAPYIFMKHRDMHIIDLNKSLQRLQVAGAMLRSVAQNGKNILFVATKKQAKTAVRSVAVELRMPYVTERWLGGMLTNFYTIRSTQKKMQSLDKMTKDEAFLNLAKKERLMKERERTKLNVLLGGISDLNRLPSALFIVDIRRENVAVSEAQKLNIPIVAMVDTNSDPTSVDFPIPANDDSHKSVGIILNYLQEEIRAGSELHKKKAQVKKSESPTPKTDTEA